MNELVVFDSNHQKAINDCELDYYSKKLATCSSDNTVKIFDVSLSKEPVCVAEMRDHSSAVWKVCWSHPKYGNLLASCSYDKSVIIYKEVQMNKYNIIYVNTEHNSSVNYIEWSPHEYGLHLGCACSDGQISIISYDLVKGSNEEGQWNKYSVKAHLNGTACISWEKTHKNKHMNEGTTGASAVAAVSAAAGAGGGGDHPNTFQLASGGFDNQVIIWMFDNSTKEFHKVYQMKDKPHNSSIKDIAWRPNLNNSTNIIASCSDENIVILWVEDISNKQWRNGQVIQVQDKISKVCWSPNGTILAIACTNENAYLYREGLNGVWEEVCNLADNEKLHAQMEAQENLIDNVGGISEGAGASTMPATTVGNTSTNQVDPYAGSYINNNPGTHSEPPNALNTVTTQMNYGKPLPNNIGVNPVGAPNSSVSTPGMVRGSLNVPQTSNNNTPYGQSVTAPMTPGVMPPPLKNNSTMSQQNVTPNYLIPSHKKTSTSSVTSNVSSYPMGGPPVGAAGLAPPPPPPVAQDQGNAPYGGLNYSPPQVPTQQGGVSAPQFPAIPSPTNIPSVVPMGNKPSIPGPPPPPGGPQQQAQQQAQQVQPHPPYQPHQPPFPGANSSTMNFAKPSSPMPPPQFQGANANKTNFSAQQISPPPPPPPPFGSTPPQQGPPVPKGMNQTNTFSNFNPNVMTPHNAPPPMGTNPPGPHLKNVPPPGNSYPPMNYSHPPPPPPNMMGGDPGAKPTPNAQYGAYPSYNPPPQ
ncbi:protein transport protein SEC13, putative [Plasmodium knowlesi strain H]|uniref:Protein transport protein SEC13, putative n=3 Tax=Plasmodium knowlesi TaxID=5850 RepID=A0A5K1UPW3_PLAKH|nr:protein transport protein SEC13, putative [Plasmodium knowlesi strain H]OTN63983.1 putative Protein transport protein SEC13 [Plasmodium knowlesi]CAA9991096.1 protein transport protein SEC13, putative [Plasmodium knowlesi strain H]SBO20603.1 protein transport protein SEC13, putative [Plasmodium knowlesi strain H]SBO21005.1 protein transport protein SEC13, putative [Plasmodium knowlesi strain H]VVS80570.1 protein transport protein SEC13, putative [Plasmodium knowlesi strain H]|eukprot:XP_002262379.1 hypothetical protein, conserved in Plasmodium species [Plasmodium knowlesi strain H]